MDIAANQEVPDNIVAFWTLACKGKPFAKSGRSGEGLHIWCFSKNRPLIYLAVSDGKLNLTRSRLAHPI